jgi:hypothetical protein
MLLKELFSPIGGPGTEEQDINWVEDLKFFIDNESEELSKHLFPAIKQHRKMGDHPKAYTIYIRPIEECAKDYITKFELADADNIFTKEDIITLAKKVAEEQNTHITNGDYEHTSAL